MIQNDRFPALSRRVSRLNMMGWLAIVLGAIFALVVLITSLTIDAIEVKVALGRYGFGSVIVRH